VRENFKRDGYLAHVGIFLTDQPEPEIALLDKVPKMMIGNFLQMAANRLQASVVITISEGYISQSSNRVQVVIISVQSAIGKMESFTPITRPELPELFESFSYTSELKGDFAICFSKQKIRGI
jgi:hypothetical protein